MRLRGDDTCNISDTTHARSHNERMHNATHMAYLRVCSVSYLCRLRGSMRLRAWNRLNCSRTRKGDGYVCVPWTHSDISMGTRHKAWMSCAGHDTHTSLVCCIPHLEFTQTALLFLDFFSQRHFGEGFFIPIDGSTSRVSSASRVSTSPHHTRYNTRRNSCQQRHAA